MGSILLATSLVTLHAAPSGPRAALLVLLMQTIGMALLTGHLVACLVPGLCLAPAVWLWPQTARIVDGIATYGATMGAPLVLFARTLMAGREPLISTLARRIHGTLRPDVARYTRRLTGVWCGYFAIALLAPAVLFATGPTPAWRWPQEGGALIAAIVLMVVEYPVRRLSIRNFDHASFSQSVAAFCAHTARPTRPQGEDA